MSSVRIVGNSPHPQFWVTSALPVTHPELKEFESWPISRRKNILRKECLSLLRRRRGRTEAKLYFNHENMLGISVSCRPSEVRSRCGRNRMSAGCWWERCTVRTKPPLLS